MAPHTGIKSNSDAVAAASAFLQDVPCLIDAPTALAAATSRDPGSGTVTVKVTWVEGAGPTSSHTLDASSVGTTLPSGALAQVRARSRGHVLFRPFFLFAVVPIVVVVVVVVVQLALVSGVRCSRTW